MKGSTMLTEEERQALQQVVGGALWTAIEKFAAAKKLAMDSLCAGAMQSLPRHVDLAADCAAKAEVYKLLTLDLERFAEKPC